MLLRDRAAIRSALARSQDTSAELIDLVERAGDLIELKQCTRDLASQNENHILEEDEEAGRRLYGQEFDPTEFNAPNSESD